MRLSRKIFISYRRNDGAADARSIAASLTNAFGAKNVFLDIDIKAGTEFPSELSSRLNACSIMIVVIGRNWIGIHEENKNDKPRIWDETDWVHQEVIQALERGMVIIPALVDGASLPDASEIPESLRRLLNYNAITLTNNGFRYEMQRLIDDIKSHLRPQTSRMFRISTASISLAVIAIFFVYFSNTKNFFHRDRPAFELEELIDNSKAPDTTIDKNTSSITSRTQEIKRLEAEIDEMKQKLFKLKEEVGLIEIKMRVEEGYGAGTTGKPGRGPIWRRLEDEARKLESEILYLDEGIKVKEKLLSSLSENRQ